MESNVTVATALEMIFATGRESTQFGRQLAAVSAEDEDREVVVTLDWNNVNDREDFFQAMIIEIRNLHSAAEVLAGEIDNIRAVT